MSSHILEIQKTDLQQTRWTSVDAAALAAGQVRFRIERFAFTANNITYAAFGDAMSYWAFYPSADAAWGVVPVWGFARVAESRCEGVEAGELFYGYWPFADSVVLTPAHVSPKGFTESAAHRTPLAAVYNQYNRCSTDAFYSPANEDVQCILRPLYITSWLIDDFFSDNSDFGASTYLLSSASSKTAYGTAFAVSQRTGPRPRVVGLTSERNRAFCESLGCYDAVLAYESLDRIEAGASVAYVDFAGNSDLRRQVHTRFGNLRYSCSIGGTHVSELGGARDLPGPKVTLFFAPAQIKKRAADWGGGELNRRLVSSWHAFAQRVSDPVQPWLRVHTHSGFDQALAAYQEVLKGQGDPSSGLVVCL